jgi:hypothetical protein
MALSLFMRFGKIRTVDAVFLLISVQWLMFTEAKVKKLIQCMSISKVKKAINVRNQVMHRSQYSGRTSRCN